MDTDELEYDSTTDSVEVEFGEPDASSVCALNGEEEGSVAAVELPRPEFPGAERVRGVDAHFDIDDDDHESWIAEKNRAHQPENQVEDTFVDDHSTTKNIYGTTTPRRLLLLASFGVLFMITLIVLIATLLSGTKGMDCREGMKCKTFEDVDKIKSEACEDGLCQVEQKAVGSICSNDIECADGMCPGGICTSGEFQAKCKTSSHCRNGLCVDGRCSASEEGGWCRADKGCSVNYVCDMIERRCQYDPDHSCKKDDECRSGMCRKGRCSDGRYGEICNMNKDCKGGYCFEGFCSKAVVGGWCDMNEGCYYSRCQDNKCMPPIQNGKACGDSSQCETGYCDVRSGSGICSDKNKLGEVCDGLLSCVEGFCHPTEGVCVEKLKDGEECGNSYVNSNLMCESGYCQITFRSGNFCAPRVDEGFDCNSNDECALDLFCSDESNTCEILKESGKACESDLQCQSFDCDGNPGGSVCS